MEPSDVLDEELKEDYSQIIKKSFLSEKLLGVDTSVSVADNTHVIRYRAPYKLDIKSSTLKEKNLSVEQDKAELIEYFNIEIGTKIKDNKYEVFKIEYKIGDQPAVRIVIGYVSFRDNRIVWAKIKPESFKSMIVLLKDQLVNIQYNKLLALKSDLNKSATFLRMISSMMSLFRSNNQSQLDALKEQAAASVENKKIYNVYDCFGIEYISLCIYDSIVDNISLRMFQIYANDIVLMLTRLPSFVYYNISKSANDISNCIVGETFMDNTDFIYKFLRSRSDYTAWFNSYMYTNVYNWKTYIDNFKVKRPKSNRDDLDLLLFEYFSEKSLSLDELASYFKLDPNVMFKIYLEKYSLNGRKVLDDFFQNCTEAQLSEYVLSNIHRYTNYLFNEYDMPNEFDKYFIFLISYLYNVSKTGLFLLLSFVVNVKNKSDLNYTMIENNESINILNIYRQNHLAYQFPVYDDTEHRISNSKINYDNTSYSIPPIIKTNNSILQQNIKDFESFKSKGCSRQINYNDNFDPSIIKVKQNLNSVIKEWSMVEYLNDDDYRLQVARERERQLEMYYLKESSINLLENPKFFEDGKLFGLQESYKQTIERQKKLEEEKKINVPQLKDVLIKLSDEKKIQENLKYNYYGTPIPDKYIVSILEENDKKEKEKLAAILSKEEKKEDKKEEKKSG